MTEDLIQAVERTEAEEAAYEVGYADGLSEQESYKVLVRTEIARLTIVIQRLHRGLSQVAYGTWGDEKGQPSLASAQRYARTILEGHGRPTEAPTGGATAKQTAPPHRDEYTTVEEFTTACETWRASQPSQADLWVETLNREIEAEHERQGLGPIDKGFWDDDPEPYPGAGRMGD